MSTLVVYKLFSFTKVWKVAVGGSSLIMVLMIVFGIFWGTCFGILPRQSAFVAACLSLSSTPLVAKFVESKGGDSSVKGNAPVNNYSKASLEAWTKCVFKPIWIARTVVLFPYHDMLRSIASSTATSKLGMLNSMVGSVILPGCPYFRGDSWSFKIHGSRNIFTKFHGTFSLIV